LDDERLQTAVRAAGRALVVSRPLPETEVYAGLIAFDDLLWLLEFQDVAAISVDAKRFPRRVLELFTTGGLVKWGVGTLELTERGARALQNLI
jgi:hypothetical protein